MLLIWRIITKTEIINEKINNSDDESNKYKLTGNVIAANIWGKLKTVSQMIGIILILFVFGIVLNNPAFHCLVQNLGLLVATVFSVVSGVIYEIQIFSNKENKVNEEQEVKQ